MGNWQDKFNIKTILTKLRGVMTERENQKRVQPDENESYNLPSQS